MILLKDCNTFMEMSSEEAAERALLEHCMAEGCSTNRHYWTDTISGKTKFVYKYEESSTAVKGL